MLGVGIFEESAGQLFRAVTQDDNNCLLIGFTWKSKVLGVILSFS